MFARRSTTKASLSLYASPQGHFAPSLCTCNRGPGAEQSARVEAGSQGTTLPLDPNRYHECLILAVLLASRGRAHRHQRPNQADQTPDISVRAVRKCWFLCTPKAEPVALFAAFLPGLKGVLVDRRIGVFLPLSSRA